MLTESLVALQRGVFLLSGKLLAHAVLSEGCVFPLVPVPPVKPTPWQYHRPTFPYAQL